MARLRSVICDDELLARQKLVMMLGHDPDIQVVQQCASVRQSVAAIKKHRPSLVFLDIQMPDGDGFDVLRAIDSEPIPQVVFTTAHDQFAIRAFEEQAIDYLLKPFDTVRLTKTLTRVKALWSAQENAESLSLKVMDSIGALEKRIRGENRLVVKAEGRTVFLDTPEIEWIESAANYVRFHAGAAAYLIRGSLTDTQEKLDRRIFVRIHRSIIVNVNQIREITPCNSGEFIVTLRNGKALPASRSFRENLTGIMRRPQ